jgi:hypothetical protein
MKIKRRSDEKDIFIPLKHSIYLIIYKLDLEGIYYSLNNLNTETNLYECTNKKGIIKHILNKNVLLDQYFADFNLL